MTTNQRTTQLRADGQRLEELAQRSPILELVAHPGDPPDHFTLVFHGQGLARPSATSGRVTLIDQHRVELRLPYAYPQAAPDLRWRTPVLHPNISFSGFIRLQDVGIEWDVPVPLDQVCTRLWDVARLKYINPSTATNFRAKHWFEQQKQWQLPVDRRALSGQDDTTTCVPTGAVPSSNRPPVATQTVSTTVTQDDDILYIDENTPLPPVRFSAPRPAPRDDDDILFIGGES